MIVADTTLVTYFLIDGQFTAEAERVRARDVDWIAPRLLRSELLNVLSSYIRFRGMDRDLAVKLFRRGISMVDMTDPDPDPVEVLNISQAGPCTGYDAEFVWLARRRNVRFVTTDGELLGAFPDVAVHPSQFA